MELRDYQKMAVASTLEALKLGCHPVISLPTGSGKALCLAALCQALPGRLLQTTHVKELVQQNAEELLRYDPTQEVGIYSAGLERRETHQRIIIGGVQSIYTRMLQLQERGMFQYILIDEVHRCAPRDAEAKMYSAVFAACPKAQRIGLTATPYRLDGGIIYGKPDSWFDVLAHETGMRMLTPEYLAPLRGVLTAHDMDTTGVRSRQGDFVTGDLSQVACNEDLVEETITELCWLARKRHRWLLFCVDVAHTNIVTEALRAKGIAVGTITGETSSDDRAAVLRAFRAGSIQALTNCQVLTTGYNCPSIDCIAVIRPTQSKALFLQMIGRGSRKSEGKKDCSILDYGGNTERFTPLDDVWDIHKSPQRVEKEAKAEAHRKRARQLAHDTEASLLDPMGEDTPSLTIPVDAVYYELAASRNPGQPGKSLLKVTYQLRSAVHKWATAWVCNEYIGGARFHAAQWFARRKTPMPNTAQEAYEQAKRGRYAVPEAVVVKHEGKYLRIVVEQFAEKEDA